MRPLTLIPWQQDFIPALGQLLIERDDLSECTILFPHNRPRRYLKAFFQAHTALARPFFLPRMTSITDFVTTIRRNVSDIPVKHVNQLDLVELLRDIVISLQREGRGLLAQLPKLDRENFLPWGLRLAKLMDDLLRQDIEPHSLKYMEGEVAAYASGLLEQLNAIHQEYVTRLSEKNWTTSGLNWRFITQNIDDVADYLSSRAIVAAGFYALCGAEDTLFRRLWEDGILTPFLHSDPALATNNKPHWSVAEHKAWLSRWHTTASIPAGMQGDATSPVIRFCEGFDRHSQLAALSEDLNNVTALDNSAIVLPDEGALMPVLHHLPDIETNISMGYPLERTSLARLLEIILVLQENRLEDGRYAWRDVINLVRHPYLRLLGPEDKPLRKIFQTWEAEIRTGEQYIAPLAWQPPYADKTLSSVDKQTAEPIRKEVLAHCITAFERIDSLEALGNALNALATMLHTHGETVWQTYLVDAECLFRLTTSVIPQLKDTEIGREKFSKTTLFSLLRRILSQERVSFEPEPLAGLQVLGVLETRLLHFKHLFILDAVEDRLPGTNPYDPLLPDSLRKLLGLPDTRERDNVSGYNFYRLLMGAKEVVIYYQNGIQPGLLDMKSVRSRFVEQLLWEQEKQKHRIIQSGDAEIHAVVFPTSSVQKKAPAITITNSMHALFEDTLQKRGLSPSRLDQYMHCPKQFFYTYLSRVRPLDQVNDGENRTEFGTLIHKVLREYFTQYIGKKINLASLDPLPLLDLFETRFRESEMHAHLPHDTRLALTQTGRYRLKTYLASQEPAILLHLEEQFTTQLNVDNLIIPLSGQVDRVEEREEGVFILDYKTGSGLVPRKGFWDDKNLWKRIQTYGPDVVDPLLLDDISRAAQSIQLPMYMYIYSQTEHPVPHDAGLIKLGDDGKTVYTFGEKWTEQKRLDAVAQMTPTLIKTLIRHMLTTTHFTAQPGRHCNWCDFKAPCGA